jgi:predicted RNA binding protein YcfA (HicA-like mRNA interferase family)
MKTSEVKRLLRGAGCYFVSHGGNHDKWYSPITNNYFILPRHDGQELPLGTLNAIKKQSGVL